MLTEGGRLGAFLAQERLGQVFPRAKHSLSSVMSHEAEALLNCWSTCIDLLSSCLFLLCRLILELCKKTDLFF